MNHDIKRRTRRRPMAEINVVPYIDVMLVLLIIFMVTAPLLSQGVHVNLPQTQSKSLPAKQKPIILSIDQTGNYFLNTSKNPSEQLTPQKLTAGIIAALQNKSKQEVYVKADKNVKYAAVMQAMVLLQKAGADQVGLITEPNITNSKH